jgi:Fe2+ or Zn2+ uptake regulation protein
MPRISLGTVYRNLDILVESGEAIRLVSEDSEARYDGNPRPHAHIQCRSCSRIDDLNLMVPALDELSRGDLHGYEVESYSLLFTGVCPACRVRD